MKNLFVAYSTPKGFGNAILDDYPDNTEVTDHRDLGAVRDAIYESDNFDKSRCPNRRDLIIINYKWMRT